LSEGPAHARSARHAILAAAPPDAAVSETTAPARTGAGRRAAPAWRPGPAAALLALILAVQAGLSLRLVWTNTAFQDEALYLWAGRLEIAHWLHGAPIPAFPTYFSGAPVLYPPLGALANSLDGLAGARILSLVMMLGATVLLWRTAGLLISRRAALFAAALWAVLGPTLHLGAFATFDPMSVCLMAAAAACAVRAGRTRDATGWTIATAAAMVLSDITTYSSIIFDPVILALAALTALDRHGRLIARSRVTSLLAYAVTALAVLAKLGGAWYVQGLVHTVLDRASSTTAASAVLGQSWAWTGAIVVLAGAGLAVGLAVERTGPRRLVLLVLLAAALLVPAEQARIHTMTSLDKHADVGAWFAAIAAGYAVDRLIALWRPAQLRAALAAACAAALYFPVTAGIAQSSALDDWPNAAAFVTWLRPLADGTRGRMLVETPSVAEYYLPAGTQWQRWSSTFNVTLPSGHDVEHSGRIGYPANAVTYRRFIATGYFSVIALNHGMASALDRALARYIAQNRDYSPVAVVPYGRAGYTIWVLRKGRK